MIVDGGPLGQITVRLIGDTHLRPGDRVGLILFGSAAFVQTPFTEDIQACRALLAEAEIGMAGPQTVLGDLHLLALDDVDHDVFHVVRVDHGGIGVDLDVVVALLVVELAQGLQFAPGHRRIGELPHVHGVGRPEILLRPLAGGPSLRQDPARTIWLTGQLRGGPPGRKSFSDDRRACVRRSYLNKPSTLLFQVKL